jgi:hypothetical protein
MIARDTASLDIDSTRRRTRDKLVDHGLGVLVMTTKCLFPMAVLWWWDLP